MSRIVVGAWNFVYLHSKVIVDEYELTAFSLLELVTNK